MTFNKSIIKTIKENSMFEYIGKMIHVIII